jgi:hypothetical protein
VDCVYVCAGGDQEQRGHLLLCLHRPPPHLLHRRGSHGEENIPRYLRHT